MESKLPETIDGLMRLAACASNPVDLLRELAIHRFVKAKNERELAELAEQRAREVLVNLGVSDRAIEEAGTYGDLSDPVWIHQVLDTGRCGGFAVDVSGKRRCNLAAEHKGSHQANPFDAPIPLDNE